MQRDVRRILLCLWNQNGWNTEQKQIKRKIASQKCTESVASWKDSQQLIFVLIWECGVSNSPIPWGNRDWRFHTEQPTSASQHFSGAANTSLDWVDAVSTRDAYCCCLPVLCRGLPDQLLHRLDQNSFLSTCSLFHACMHSFSIKHFPRPTWDGKGLDFSFLKQHEQFPSVYLFLQISGVSMVKWEPTYFRNF